MTKYYIATDKDGRVYTRATHNRTYTHAVVWRGYASWAGSPDLARKQAARGGDILDAYQVPAREFPRTVRKGVRP